MFYQAEHNFRHTHLSTLGYKYFKITGTSAQTSPWRLTIFKDRQNRVNKYDMGTLKRGMRM